MVCLSTKNDRLAKGSKKMFVIRHELKTEHNRTITHADVQKLTGICLVIILLMMKIWWIILGVKNVPSFEIDPQLSAILMKFCYCHYFWPWNGTPLSDRELQQALKRKSQHVWTPVLMICLWSLQLPALDHWGDLDVDGWIILGWISRRWDVGIWTRLVWPRIETGGRRLWVRWWIFGFREMRGISLLAANQLTFQEGLCTME